MTDIKSYDSKPVSERQRGFVIKKAINFGNASVAGVIGDAVMTLLIVPARIIGSTTMDLRLKPGSMARKRLSHHHR